MASHSLIPTLNDRNTACLNVESLATRLPAIGSLRAPSVQVNLPWVQWEDIYTEADSSADQLRAWVVYLVYLREAMNWDADDHDEMRQYLSVKRLYRLKGLNRLAPSRTMQYCVANTREESYTLSIGHLLKTLFPKHPVVEFWALHRRVYPGVPTAISRAKEPAEATRATGNPIELGFDGIDAGTSLAARSQGLGIDSYLTEVSAPFGTFGREQTPEWSPASTPILIYSDLYVQDCNPLTYGITLRTNEAERPIESPTSDVTMTGTSDVSGHTTPLSSEHEDRDETSPSAQCYYPARVFGNPTEQTQNESMECDLSTLIVGRQAPSDNTRVGNDQTKRSTETHGCVSNHSAILVPTSENIVTSL
ncbi:unnamed protein product [Clonostachys rosea]|uniref:Uncharacterized protein n=1 Tax=Bionectria ochroleuca TaxID=29856 RepID=A0ABY6TQ86_BIOOC|nr:unnamed protein product [Clonostachys rosea]